jgi:triacylglycerol lipase
MIRRIALGIAMVCVSAVVSGCAPAAPAASGADPVIIAAGTFGPQVAYEPMAQRLRSAGYQVFIYVIPSPLSPYEESAATFNTYLNRVLETTGRSKVDIIGHSQGSILARYAMRFLGADTKVDTLVALSGVHYGSTLGNVGVFLGFGDCLGIVICQQVAEGSAFNNSLNQPNDALPGIHYVNITTIFDEAVIPYTNNLLRGTGDITNVVVQDQCPLRIVGHLLLATDGAVASGISDALAKRPITLDCLAL